MAQLNFDASQYNPEMGIGQLPVGRHIVIIEKDEIKKAQASDGGYLQLDLKCVQGEAQGQGQAYRLNLYNQNPKTVDIAMRQLSAVCYAVGVLGINGDTSVLWNLPFMVDVALQKGDEAKEKGYTEVIRVLTVNGEEIKAGMTPGGNRQNSQQQGGGFGQQAQQTNQGGGFGQPQQQQNQNQNQQQEQQTQQQPQFGQPQQQNQQQQPQFGQPQQTQQTQQSGWQPGNTAGGGQPQQQWQPRQN